MILDRNSVYENRYGRDNILDVKARGEECEVVKTVLAILKSILCLRMHACLERYSSGQLCI